MSAISKLRSKLQKPAAKFIIAILLIPFAFLGYNAFSGAVATPSPLVVNGNEVPANEILYQVAILAENEELTEIDAEDRERLSGEALEGVIEQYLLEEVGEDWGLVPTQTFIAEYLVDTAQVVTDGKFDQEKYRALAASIGLSQDEFTDLLKRQITLAQIQRTVGLATFVDDTEGERFAKMTDHTRNIKLWSVKTHDFTVESLDIDLSEEAMQKWYDENPDVFTDPEYFTFETLLIDEEQIKAMAEIEVTDEAVNERVEELIEEWEPEILRDVAHIEIVHTENDRTEEEALSLAQELLTRIGAGEDFATLAEEYSDDTFSAEEGGNVGTSDGETFPQKFEDALAELEVGAVSEPVQINDRVHLIKLLDLTSSEPPLKEELLVSERENLYEAALEDTRSSIIEELEEQAWTALTFDELPSEDLPYLADAKKEEKEKLRYPFWTILNDPPPKEEFLQDGVLGPFDTDDGILLLVLKEHTPEFLKNFDDNFVQSITKSRIEFDTQKQARNDIVTAVEEMLADGVPFETAALTQRPEADPPEIHTDLSPDSDVLVTNILNKVFALPAAVLDDTSEKSFQRVEFGDTVYLFELTGVNISGVPDSSDKERYNSLIQRGNAQGVVLGLIEQAESDAEIDKKEELLAVN